RGGKRGAGAGEAGVLTSPPPGAPNTFLGSVLIALGGLVALLCGSCTLLAWGGGLVAFLHAPNAAAGGGMLTLFLLSGVVGGLPAAAGAIAVWAGLRMIRPPKKASE
ncbi:MAG TPA: hypothetical protein VKU90_05465, partial [Caulobacteraceae bacterium]|nr:hypothetical protein [Caulobacteraceae bacterium]